jgi:hypothetical protein
MDQPEPDSESAPDFQRSVAERAPEPWRVTIPIGHPPEPRDPGERMPASAVDELRTLTRISAENADLRTENANLRAILAGRPARDPILDLVDLSKTLAQALVNLSEGK